MKRFIMAAFIMVAFTTAAYAENFTYIVPAAVDGGTAKWAQQVTKQWNKFLKNYGHTASLRYIKQQKGKKGATEFATTYLDDPTVLLQFNNVISWVTSSRGWKGFDPRKYTLIGGQVQGTFVFAKTKLPDVPAIHIGGGAETIVDAMAAVMMLCGPMDLVEILQCQKESLRYIKGWRSGGQRRKAYLSGDIQISRDGFSHMKKTYKDELKSGKSKVWFSHGMVDKELGITQDPNSPNTFFDQVYYKKWNQQPTGDYFDVYRKTIMLRSGLSKYLMVHVNNPHYEDLVNSFKDMLKDKGAKKALNKKLGNYPWMVGTVIEDVHMRIWDSLDEKSLKNMETIRRSFGANSNINPKLN